MADLSAAKIALDAVHLNVIAKQLQGIELGKFLAHCKAVLSPSAFPHEDLWKLVSRPELEAAYHTAQHLAGYTDTLYTTEQDEKR